MEQMTMITAKPKKGKAIEKMKLLIGEARSGRMHSSPIPEVFMLVRLR
jgi:hypothetical protein